MCNSPRSRWNTSSSSSGKRPKSPSSWTNRRGEECRRVLSAFFAEMTEWERYMERAGFEDAEAVPRLLAIWEKYVSEKPVRATGPWASRTAPRAPTRGKNFWTRSRSPRTRSTSTPERKTPALAALSHETGGRRLENRRGAGAAGRLAAHGIVKSMRIRLEVQKDGFMGCKSIGK